MEVEESVAVGVEPPEVDQTLTKREASPEPARGTETILLVEDDDSVRELAQEVLEMSGYTVVSASNGLVGRVP